MNRERVLKVVLVVLGLLFCAGVYPLVLMAKEEPALAMTDESLRHARHFLAACGPKPVRQSQPDRVHGVVELCARHCDGSAGISKFHRSSRTARSGYLHCDRRSSDRSGSGKAASRASFYRGGIKFAPLALDTTDAARAAVFSSCVQGDPTILPRAAMCWRTPAAALLNVAFARSSNSRSRIPITGM